MTSILGYIGIKFDQVNEHIQDMTSNDNRKIKQAWENSMLHPSQCRFLKISSNKRIIWTIILNNILHTIINLFWLSHNIFKLFIINYVCEKVSAKANATKNFVNRISYSTRNVEMCENISQLLLQLTYSPLRFYGLGLFQYGFKFLRGFTTSVTTVVVILIQSQIHNKPFIMLKKL
ncbi:uncharacterized protein LOC115236967 [Formica exsecta]|uniref:uncharacterized protein LOC115236967 n=1 Tax=Formica exsecta TaxID=72781 RepID=UPI0011412574|nr:uncharacterized protein LOC115236967 [Formica exsecta]